MARWTPQDSEELYNVHGWGLGYFRVNEKGNMCMTPPGGGNRQIDIKLLVDDLLRRGITLPILIRFTDLVRARVETIATAFTPYLGALLLTLLATMFLFVFIRVDRIPIEYALLPLLPIVADLLSGSLESVGRHTMAGFPLLWILANRRSIAMRRGWPMVSAGLFAIVAVLTFGGFWVP